MKRKLAIDMQELCLAFQNDSPEMLTYLDPETGAMVLAIDPIVADGFEDGDELMIQLDTELDEERYLVIPHDSTQTSYEDMAAFVETIENEDRRALFEEAIDGKDVFSRFRRALSRFDDLTERWYPFKEERVRQRVLAWLDDEDIEPA